ncbi:MAG TPA: hypothetical protein VF331_04195 [Polyangiales bacterium]|jgi:hypothetical protein
MYLWSTRSSRIKNRKRSNRFRAKLKAKNRRRINRMAGRSQGLRRSKTR